VGFCDQAAEHADVICALPHVCYGPKADLVDGVDSASIEQDSLREGGLPRINMCRDADVSHIHQSVAFFYIWLWHSAKLPETRQLLPTAEPGRLTYAWRGQRSIDLREKGPRTEPGLHSPRNQTCCPHLDGGTLLVQRLKCRGDAYSRPFNVALADTLHKSALLGWRCLQTHYNGPSIAVTASAMTARQKKNVAL